MEDLSGVNFAIKRSIEVMQTCFNGIKIELLSEDMYRQSPSEFCQVGYVGVDIKVNNIKTFLKHETAELIVYEPFGKMIAEEFIYHTIKQ